MFKNVNKVFDTIIDGWLEMGMTDATTYKKAIALSVISVPILPITGITYVILYSKALSKLKNLED